MTTYMEMKNPMYSTISDKITQSYPDSCICWIEEIVNDKLRQEYTDLKEENTVTSEYCNTTDYVGQYNSIFSNNGILICQ